MPLRALALLISLIFVGPIAFAAELKEGMEINKGNLDQMLSQTIDGKTIDNLTTPMVKRWIKEKNLRIFLRNYEVVPVDPRWIENTKKHSSKVKFDPATRNVTGYISGLAFPNLDEKDPNIADKIIWNTYLSGGWPRAEFEFIPKFGYVMVDGDKGLDRTMMWGFLRVVMTGRLSEPNLLDDGKTFYQQVLLAREPYDIMGLGSFRIRYMGGDSQDDGWYYIKSMRRTRRISGGAWFDPIGGTDQLNDEISQFSAYPNWYPSYKLVGKTWILACQHGRYPHWTPKDDKGGAANYPSLDMSGPPFWNPLDDWEPRPVYIIEGQMPEEHPYGRRVWYVDAETWVPHYSEAYDKKGEFVKMLYNSSVVVRGVDAPTSWGVSADQGHAMDWKINHGTIYFQGEASLRNPPLGQNDANLQIMEMIAQGRYKEPGPFKSEWDVNPTSGYANFKKDPNYKKCQDLAPRVSW